MLRIIKNRSIVKYVLAILGLMVALYFAWNFFAFGDWSGRQFLSDVPGASWIVGAVCFCIMGGLVLMLIFFKEHMLEDYEELSRMKRNNSYINALRGLIFFAAGLEVCSVLFRITILGTSKYNFILFGIGILGIALTYIIAKVLYAELNRPPELQAARIMNDAGILAMEEAGSNVHRLSPNDKRRVYGGDFEPLDQIQETKYSEEYQKQSKKSNKRKEKERQEQEYENKRQKSKEISERFLTPDPTPIIDTLDTPSPNGHKTRSFQ